MNDINFKNIIPRGGSQTKAFEELCTQLARKTLQSTDEFERYHGDGGDGGVECTSKSVDGLVTGWQSKFVTNIDDLIKQASSSLATAVKIHPTLKKYIVCFPFDVTGQTGRRDKKGRPAKSGSIRLENWTKDSLAAYKAEGAELEEIELWPANRLTELLLEHDASAGIRTYFFSDTTIPQNWFEKNIATSVKKAGPRYNSELTVETGVWKSFAAFGQTESWDTVILEELNKVRKHLKEFGGNIDKPNTDPVFPGLPKKYSTQATAICSDTNSVLQLLSGTLTDNVLTAAEVQLTKVIESVIQLEKELVNDLNEQYKGEQWDNKRWRSFMREYMVSFPAANLDSTRGVLLGLRSLVAFIQSPDVKLASEKVFVLSGIGGSGKTHCICDIAAQRLQNEVLSCIVFGDQFSGNPDEWTRFGEALGLKNISSDQVLDALNAAAQQSGKPLIIFLDAINETIPRSYWTSKIVAFAHEIIRRPFLKLCISCRSSFLRTCLPEPNPFLTVEHTGFKGFEREACNAFFTFYGLNPPLIPVLQPELSNPLYLKLVCATLQARGLKDLPAGWTGLLPVIKAFLFEKEKQLCKQYDLSPNGALVVTALTAIIKEIARRTEASLSWADATMAITRINLPIASHNLLDWLVTADLLIEDGSLDSHELASQTYVRPAFERLGDFLLAAEIGKQATATGLDAFLKHQKVQEIFKDEISIKLNASLIAALSIILPENHGAELPSLFIGLALYSDTAIIATKALIWRTPDSLTDATRLFVEDTLSKDGYTAMDALFSVCANKSRLDALWLNEILRPTSLAYRDAFFAPYLNTRYNENGIVKRLIEAHHDIDLSFLKADTAYKWIIALIWMTASPDRRIKDTATRAAVAILEHHNGLAIDLLDQLLFINDEEVVERLLLIIYGAQILSPNKVVLANVTGRLGGSYAQMPSTFENALIRDHIRCIAELAQQLDCLPASIDPLTSHQTKIEEGWMLPMPDDTVVDAWKKEKGARGLAAQSALNDDFNHYSIDCLDPWQKNLRKMDIGKWIINDVVERKGLNNKMHSAYDVNIVQATGGGRSKPAYAERVGKKYQWNSLYRLSSILHDRVEREYGLEPDSVRTPLILQDERKIDPTLTQPYVISAKDSKNWWVKEKPDLAATEKLTPAAWLNFNEDIPAMQSIISVNRFNEQNWIPVSGHLSYDTSKTDEGYGSPYRLLKMSFDAYLVRSTDIKGIIEKLDGKNLNTVGLPSGGKFSHCYMGEYPWATACNTEPDWYLGVKDTFADTNIEMHNATNDMVAEWEYDDTLKENLYLQVPSKKFFEPCDLWWNGKDGYKRPDHKTVFKVPRIETGGKPGLVADFEDLVSRLKKLEYNIIWVLMGDKLLINHHAANDRKYFSQICWMDASGQLFFGKRMFFKSYDAKKGTQEKLHKIEKTT